MCKTHRPQRVCVIFDHPQHRTVRKQIDPNYKSNRKPTPTVLRSQFDLVKETLELATINFLSIPGFEADDLIASYTEVLLTIGMDVLVISNDNDLLQLARDSSLQLECQENHVLLSTVEIYQPNTTSSGSSSIVWIWYTTW
jgi:DNA polymerase-1